MNKVENKYATPFSDSSRFYDLLYSDKDYQSEVDYINGVLFRLGSSVNSILELGSGTGGHGTLLANQGISVVGVERSSEMISLAKLRAVPGFECELGDIRSIRMNLTFDAVLSLFHVISYMTSDNDLQKAFETANSHLKIGGIFLFDVWHGPAVLAQKPSVRIRQKEIDDIRLKRVAEHEID